MSLPRGIRNNNPGNIRHGTHTFWVGEAREQPDAEFISFSSPVYGMRAVMKILLTYYKRYNLHTIESIINRYAPPVENDTISYVTTVSKISGVKKDEVINDISLLLIPLSKAISLHENGNPPEDMPAYWFKDEIYDSAKRMALL